jgi:hypothetical protein
VLIDFIRILGLGASTAFDENTRETFLQQKRDVLRCNGNTFLTRIGLGRDTNGELRVGYER